MESYFHHVIPVTFYSTQGLWKQYSPDPTTKCTIKLCQSYPFYLLNLTITTGWPFGELHLVVASTEAAEWLRMHHIQNLERERERIQDTWQKNFKNHKTVFKQLICTYISKVIKIKITKIPKHITNPIQKPWITEKWSWEDHRIKHISVL